MADKLTLRPPTEWHVKEVREALEQATAAAFAGLPKEQAIVAVENVLRSIAYPASATASAADREKAASFFKELVERL